MRSTWTPASARNSSSPTSTATASSTSSRPTRRGRTSICSSRNIRLRLSGHRKAASELWSTRMFARRFCWVPLLFLAGCADPPKSEPADPPVTRAAESRWAGGAIKIDGRTDEAAWAGAQEITGFCVWWEKKPGQTHTSAKLLWDEKYFYFAADIEDYDLYADVTERNGMTWLNDVFEIFLKPSAKPAYYEFQVNAANTPLE